MSEERRSVHPEEPAEEGVEVPGLERAGDPSNPATADGVNEERPAQPDEPDNIA